LSWKSIEMQVALPRTQDAGKLQEQACKQHQHFQASLAMNQLKQEERKRKKVNDCESIDLLKNKKEGTAAISHHEGKKKAQHKAEHPYLGTNIDFNG